MFHLGFFLNFCINIELKDLIQLAFDAGMAINNYRETFLVCSGLKIMGICVCESEMEIIKVPFRCILQVEKIL